ncbi:MAG TPA: hypothetical protein VHD87_14800 [Acidimicrobiales bacterium]|nr:hypothetical protein [Acidimicrobiales bacterium]
MAGRSLQRELAVAEYRRANPGVVRSLPEVARARALVEGFVELDERMDLLEAAAGVLLQYSSDPDPHDVVIFAFAELLRERRPKAKRKAG